LSTKDNDLKQQQEQVEIKTMELTVLKTIQYQKSEVKAGYADRILELDMAAADMSQTQVSAEFKKKYLGGRGYALKLIWERTSSCTRFDSPENVLVMAGGPLCGDARFPGSGKFIVGTISPLTDTFIDSNVGGHFAPMLKRCGFDAIAVTGISEKELVVIVDGDRGVVEIAEAPQFGAAVDDGGISYGERLLIELSGGTPSEHLTAVTSGLGAVHTRYGIINSVYFDKRRGRFRTKQAGRGGTGTVMRAKGLKAVIAKSQAPKVKANFPMDGRGVKSAGADLKKIVSQNDPQQLQLGNWGTTALIEYMDKFHILPVNNYQQGQHPRSKELFAEVFLNSFFSKDVPDGCYSGCNLACAKGAEQVTLTRGPRAGNVVGIDGPEYETVAAVTCMGIFDPQYVMEYNWYCDQYGLDTISMGVTAAFLMECFQRGYLTRQTVGYDLNWGDIAAADRLLHDTAQGLGLGKVCGQGVLRAKHWVADQYTAGSGQSPEAILGELEKFAMETKGLEFSMYITKESLAQQGGYGFALKGPQHDEAWLIFIDQVHKELPTFEMKAKALKWFPLIRTWFNTVGLCKLPWIDVRHPEAAKTENPAQNLPTMNFYVQYFNATVGSQKSLEDILHDSERLHLLQKLINLRQGKGTRTSDRIPLRAMGPAFVEEYRDRANYYDGWLQDALEGRELPGTMEERHEMLVNLRQRAYDQLCDAVYREKGYSDQAVPLIETIEKFDLADDQARTLLQDHRATAN